mgnify:CR=1 FL=1
MPPRKKMTPEDKFAYWVKKNSALFDKILSRYPVHLREDLRQYALMGAWRAFRTFDPKKGNRLGGYVYLCAERAVRVAYDKEATRSKHGLDVCIPDPLPEVVPDPSLEVGMVVPQWRRELYAFALTRKDPLERAIVAFSMGAISPPVPVEWVAWALEYTPSRLRHRLRVLREEIKGDVSLYEICRSRLSLPREPWPTPPTYLLEPLREAFLLCPPKTTPAFVELSLPFYREPPSALRTLLP